MVTVGADLGALAEASVAAGLASLEPKVPFAVVPLAGSLAASCRTPATSTSSSSTRARHPQTTRRGCGWPPACRFSPAPRRRNGSASSTPTSAPRVARGLLSRTTDGYAAYYDRWALTWERQAMARARPVAGDADLGAFLELLDQAVWGHPFTVEDDARCGA